MNDQEEFDTETEQNIILTDADLRQLSPLDWARYGTNRIAYMRPVTVNNQRAIAIHAADGTQIGAAPRITRWPQRRSFSMGWVWRWSTNWDLVV